jgi:hypothetical protein
MDEVARFRARGVFASRAPTHFADARQHIGDRLLLSVMMYTRTGSRIDLEQPTPQGRLNAELGCDRGEAHGTLRLCRSRVKSGRADNANWEISVYHDNEPFVVGEEGQPRSTLLAAIFLWVDQM